MQTSRSRSLDKTIEEVTKDWDEAMGNSPVLGQLLEFKTLKDVYTNVEKFPTNDDDASEWILANSKDYFTYIPTSKSTGKWYYWNGAFHEEDRKGIVADRLAIYFSRCLNRVLTNAKLEALTSDGIVGDEKGKATKAFEKALTYANNARNERGLGPLRKRIQIVCTQEPNYFDNDQRWIAYKDGMVLDQMDLDGDLLEPDPRRPISKTLGIIYTGQTQKPHRWLAALDAWVPDKEEQKYLQVAAGAALSGRGDAKNIVVLVGVSNTGKSTYINILKEIFGDGEHGYAGILPATAIVQKYGGTSNFEQYKARGKRFLYLSEPQTTKTDDAFLKNLSGGGETISTAEKGQNTVDWKAQCVLHIAANHIPKFDTHDRATVDRMNLVGFDHVFKNTNQGSAGDFALELVEQEGGSILNWILDGLRMYEQLGFIPVPDSIRKKSDSNVVESSAPLRWLQEVVDDGTYIIDTGAFMVDMVEPKSTYEEFTQWCFENSEKVVSKKNWLTEIEKYNAMPPNKKGVRPGGKARVWGLVSMAAHIEREASMVSESDSRANSVSRANSNKVSFSSLTQRSE